LIYHHEYFILIKENKISYISINRIKTQEIYDISNTPSQDGHEAYEDSLESKFFFGKESDEKKSWEPKKVNEKLEKVGENMKKVDENLEKVDEKNPIWKLYFSCFSVNTL